MKTKLYFELLIMGATVLGLTWNGNGPALGQRTRPVSAGDVATRQAYDSYRGVQLGMTDQEIRAKLGEPTSKFDEQDYFAITEKEAAQIAYDKNRKAVTISVDYLDGIGAPDNKLVVNEDLEKRPNGSLYKMVRYSNLGFWVSYSRTAGPVVVVTVTIQKM
jgi:hypothetical protein